jgi:ribose transport system substrate-binding protein
MRSIARWAAIAAAVLSVLVLAGCGSSAHGGSGIGSNGGATTGGGGGGTTSAASNQAAGCSNPYGFHDPSATIGVSYAFLGNSWRETMEHDLTAAVNKAKACHEIGNVDYEYAGTSTTQQISQIDDLILKGVKVILVDSNSTTGLNAAIAKATAAGIKVVNFDTPVTATQAYILNWNYVPFGEMLAKYLVKRMGGTGNVLFVRGQAGTTIDSGQAQGWKDVLAKYPHIKVVGSVIGNWDEATVQSAVSGVLSNLPKVNAVFINGGNYGIVQSFKSAGRPVPLMVGDNRGDFLQWWWQHRKSYRTFSYSTYPQTAVLALYVAQFLLKGTSVPHALWLAPLTISQSQLSKYKSTPAAAVADAHFTVQWVYQHLVK